MTETENHDVNPEAVAPPVEDVSQTQDHAFGQEDQNQVQADQSAVDKEMNFKAIRESNARLQRQLEEERQAREHLQIAVEEKLAAHMAPSQKRKSMNSPR